MTITTTLSIKQLHQLLEYRDGELYWRVSRSRTKAGSVAGHTGLDGYKRVGIDKHYFMTHRVIFALHNGRWPSEQIDHIDGNRLNNEIINLREVTRRQNGQNRVEHRNGKLPGTTWHKRDHHWMARIRIDSKSHFLGYFHTAGEAYRAYVRAGQELAS